MESLLVKYLVGEATPDEIIRVDQWLSESAENRQLYKEFKATWEISRMIALRPSTTSAEEALNRFRQRQNTNEERSENKYSISKAPRHGAVYRSLVQGSRFWRVAALVTGVLLAAAIMILVMHPFKKTQVFAEKTAPVKRRGMVQKNNLDAPEAADLQKIVAGNLVRVATLPDKSVITLNQNAVIEYDSGFTGKERSVKLQGEAFFEVSHNELHPFLVQVNDITVKDIGTSFNVEESRDSTEIAVESGTVLITRGNDSLLVHAGEKVVEDKRGRLKKGINSDQLYGYYLDRPLVCDSVSLLRLVHILNKAYHARISIENTALEDLRITTIFPAKLPLDRILNVIRETFDISVVRIGNQPLIILK
jgi:transmembrane sensor